MSATSILSGLLGGINESAEANRAEIRRREDEQDQFERRELQRIASSPEYMPEIRERAATALLEIAANPGKRRRGSFTENLMGVNRIQAHPAVSELMRFMREPETKGGLPQGLIEAPPKAIPATPPPAVTTPPTTAAMPPTPAGQPGGGPPSAGALGSPSAAPTGQAAPTPPPLAPGLLPVNQSTGAPPQTQGPSVTVPRRILRSPAEIAIETARAKAQGDTEGEIEGLVASGMPREQALEVVRLAKVRAARGTGAPYRAVALEVPDPAAPTGWRQVQGVFNAATGDYEDAAGNPITNARPRLTTGSTSMGSDREAIARADYGLPFVQLSQVQQQDVLRKEAALNAQQAAMTTSARMGAEAVGPLARKDQVAEVRALADDWRLESRGFNALREQYQRMLTGLQRFQADPAGASESIRVSFERILDENSVVREGEYNRQQLGLGLEDRFLGFVQRLKSGGGGIPIDVLREMTETARQFVVGSERFYNEKRDQIRRRAQFSQIDPSLILGGPAAPPSLNVPAASPGTINAPAPPPSAPQGMQGQGGGPPTLSTLPANVPATGTMVGNPYKGEIRMLPDGRFIGLVNGQPTVLKKAPDGSFLY